MSSVRAEIERIGEAGYVFAKKIGMSEHRLNKLLAGRIKDIKDDDVQRIARGLKRKPADVRAELERLAAAHRVELGRET